MNTYNWHRYTVAESMRRMSIQHEEPWVVIGDFLDDWQRSARKDRAMLVSEPLEPVTTPSLQQWAAFFAAAVEHLCTQDGLPVPEWVMEPHYTLSKPWYMEARSFLLRQLQEETTPDAFKKRNVLGGDRMLNRM